MGTYKTNIPELKIVREPSNFKKVKITCSGDAYDYMKQFYVGDIEVFESMFVLLLNRASFITGYAKISQGGTAGTVVDIKIIAKYAVESLANGIILGHNHPSGNLTPSGNDLIITEKVKNGLKLLDIALLDHIILTEENYTSLADEGKI